MISHRFRIYVVDLRFLFLFFYAPSPTCEAYASSCEVKKAYVFVPLRSLTEEGVCFRCVVLFFLMPRGFFRAPCVEACRKNAF